MIAVDTNVLVYAHRRDSEWHKPAESVVRALAEGHAPWAIPWPCLHEFLAIATHPAIYDPRRPSSVRSTRSTRGWKRRRSYCWRSEAATGNE